jgi:hypothetical protein
MRLSKQPVELRSSVARKMTSSKKVLPPCVSWDCQEPVAISRSNTLRLVSAKDVKMNNFMHMKQPPKSSRTSRAVKKKKQVRK